MRTLTTIVLLVLLAVMCFVSYRQNRVIMDQRAVIKLLVDTIPECDDPQPEAAPAPPDPCDPAIPGHVSQKCQNQI